MNEVIDSLRTFESRLLHTIEGIPDDALQRAESDGRWSIRDVVAHLADTELIYAARLRAIVAEENPKLMAFQQNEWVAAHASRNIGEAIDQFSTMRRLNLRLLERLPDDAWNRTGEHATYGPLTLREAVTKQRDHAEQHLAQIERIKSAVLTRSVA